MDVFVLLELATSKLSFFSVKTNKLLSKWVHGSSSSNGTESAQLITNENNNLLEHEETKISSNRIYQRSIVTCTVYLILLLIFLLPIGIAFLFISNVLSWMYVILVWCPIVIYWLISVLAEFSQRKVIITNNRIIKDIGLGRKVSIWFEHVIRFDKVHFPDESGILFYTLNKTAFGKEYQVRYKLENITSINEVYDLVTDNSV